MLAAAVSTTAVSASGVVTAIAAATVAAGYWLAWSAVTGLTVPRLARAIARAVSRTWLAIAALTIP